MLQILFALLAGVLTIAAPCILPMLPILLGSSVGQSSKQRPLLITLGFIVSFAGTALILSFVIERLGLSPNLLRDIAVVCLAVFAFFMIWPKPFELLTTHLSGAINKANQMGSGQGNMSGLLLGLVLGIIWTPCAGPILASILVLIATQGSNAHSAILLLAYSIGAGVPMLIIAYGSQYITTKVRWVAQYSVRLQQIFGFLILLLAVAMYFQYDVKLSSALVSYFPATSLEEKLLQNSGNPVAPKNNQPDVVVSGQPTPKIKIDFEDYGKAPEFTGIDHWLNSNPLTMKDLRGKVVLVDFWTYSCINCIRTLPYVTKWYDTYKDKGLVVIGVHTPEFAFEKVTDNVAQALPRFGINYPVAQDNEYGTWLAYNNQYWPAEYLINKDGEIVHEHFGEGEYDVSENAIRQLLGLDMDPNAKTSTVGNIGSPEMYFGTNRLQYLWEGQSQPQPHGLTLNYILPTNLPLNQFTMEGEWKFEPEKATLTQGPGKIKLHFSSGKIFMVAASADPNKTITLKITVDGKIQKDVSVNMSQLYNLFDSDKYIEHTIEINIPDAGFQAFTFTFG